MAGCIIFRLTAVCALSLSVGGQSQCEQLVRDAGAVATIDDVDGLINDVIACDVTTGCKTLQVRDST